VVSFRGPSPAVAVDLGVRARELGGVEAIAGVPLRE
jgi:hypothetical protein